MHVLIFCNRKSSQTTKEFLCVVCAKINSAFRDFRLWLDAAQRAQPIGNDRRGEPEVHPCLHVHRPHARPSRPSIIQFCARRITPPMEIALMHYENYANTVDAEQLRG